MLSEPQPVNHPPPDPGSPPHDDFIDRVLGDRYLVVRKLAVGGFGAVYLAVHVGTQQEVALKVLPITGKSRHDGSLERFLREARVTAGLSHPNTVRVFDVGGAGPDGDEPPWLAMELIRGPTLEDVLVTLSRKGRTMSEQQAIDVALPVVGSLSEAHAVSLVHRDMKPSNIMLSPVPGNPPVVKLLDFGCSHVQGSNLTVAGSVYGTPGYMSPEQIEGRDLDARSDLFALGVMLHRCVTGRTPFEDAQPMPLMYRYANVDVPDPRQMYPAMSEAFGEMLLWAMARDRAMRPENAAKLRARLEEIRPRCNAVSLSDRPGRRTGQMATKMHTQQLAPVTLEGLLKLVESDGGSQIAALQTVSQEGLAVDDHGTLAYHNPAMGTAEAAPRRRPATQVNFSPPRPAPAPPQPPQPPPPEFEAESAAEKVEPEPEGALSAEVPLPDLRPRRRGVVLSALLAAALVGWWLVAGQGGEDRAPQAPTLTTDARTQPHEGHGGVDAGASDRAGALGESGRGAQTSDTGGASGADDAGHHARSGDTLTAAGPAPTVETSRRSTRRRPPTPKAAGVVKQPTAAAPPSQRKPDAGAAAAPDTGPAAVAPVQRLKPKLFDE